MFEWTDMFSDSTLNAGNTLYICIIMYKSRWFPTARNLKREGQRRLEEWGRREERIGRDEGGGREDYGCEKEKGKTSRGRRWEKRREYVFVFAHKTMQVDEEIKFRASNGRERKKIPPLPIQISSTFRQSVPTPHLAHIGVHGPQAWRPWPP